MELDILCLICKQEYSENNPPRIITCCGHTYCHECIKSQISQTIGEQCVITCPQDKMQMRISKDSLLPKNIALITYIQNKQKNSSLTQAISFKDSSIIVSSNVNNSWQDEQAQQLLTAIAKQYNFEGQKNQVIPAQLKVPQIKTKIKNQPQMCLLHNKVIQFICLHDKQRLCSKCAIFGQHKCHDIVSIDQVQQANKNCYKLITDIFDHKTQVVQKLNKKQTQKAILEILLNKTKKMKKQIKDSYKTLIQQITKHQKHVIKQLDHNLQQIQSKITKLFTIDEQQLYQYENWLTEVKELYELNQKGNQEAVISFYQQGNLMVEEGKLLISQLQHNEQNAFNASDKLIQSLGCTINMSSCISAIKSMVSIHQDKSNNQVSIVLDVVQTNQYSNLNRPSFDLRPDFNSYESLRTQNNCYDEEQSLLDAGQDLQAQFSQLKSSKVLEQNNTQITTRRLNFEQQKPRLSKLPIKLSKKPPIENKQNFMSGEMIKKKIKNYKIPQKHQKILEGILKDSLQTVDLTNAQLGDKIVLHIAQLLPSCKRVRTLKLIRNKLTDQGFNQIIPYLKGISNLNISQNMLTETTLLNLKDHFHNFSQLKTIILSQNKINERKSKTVVQNLRNLGLTVSL